MVDYYMSWWWYKSKNQLLFQVEAFFALYPDAGAGESARAEAISSIKSNIAWMDRNLEAIITWLEEYLGEA